MNVLHCPGLFWNSSWWLASKYKHATFAINEKSYLKFSTPLHPPSCNHCYAWFACPPPDSKMDIGLARLMEMSFMREYNPKYNHPATLCFGMKNKKTLLITSISSFIGCSWETFFGDSVLILDLTQMWSSCRLKSSRFTKADSQNFSTSGDRIILEHNSLDFSQLNEII